MKDLLIISCHAEDSFTQSKLFKSVCRLYCDNPSAHLQPLGLKQQETNGVLYNFKPNDTGFEVSDISILCFPNNRNLPISYNKGITYAIQNAFKHVAFVHDDVSIEDSNVVTKIHEACKTFDVVGIAGGSDIKLQEPALWHIMSSKHSGSAGHSNSEGKVWMTCFGLSPARVLILDGLFLACSTDTLAENKHLRFDEALPHGGFHHYDIDFCLHANKEHLKCTTWPIWVVHSSPGLASYTPEFLASQTYFLDKWK